LSASIRADQYDDDGTLSSAYIANRIGVLMASFPHGGPPSPEVFLESTCREVVDKRAHMPVVKEIVPVLEQHIEQWRARRSAMQWVESARIEAVKALVEHEGERRKR
jgi:hypothetical protein